MSFFKKPDYITQQIVLELSALTMACGEVGLSEKDHRNYNISYGTEDDKKYLTVTNTNTGETSGRYYFS